MLLHSETREFSPSADLVLRCRPPNSMEEDELVTVSDDDKDEGGGGALEEDVALRTSRRSAAPQRIRPMAANFHNFILE